MPLEKRLVFLERSQALFETGPAIPDLFAEGSLERGDALGRIVGREPLNYKMFIGVGPFVEAFLGQSVRMHDIRFPLDLGDIEGPGCLREDETAL